MDRQRRVRIGIDVGGTFTDAVAIDSDDFSIISSVKTPTTHSAPEGVARGVIDSLEKILKEGNIQAAEISFIAHGTTQATNALLEGDVSNVGIFGMGAGIEGLKARGDTVLGNIEVSDGKYIKTSSLFMDTSSGVSSDAAKAGIKTLLENGAQVIVASEAFSVDNPENEKKIQELCRGLDVPVTGGHEISKLYGLKARTRTAVINASILPKMMNTADMTQKAVQNARIQTPLMIMRCDGGVMKIDEVRSRPILTILSGPAAGVAGALMYERVSDGIFLEVGGTSTDISAIRNGRVMINYAEIGGHKTYVSSLDVRTIGLGGGSMIRLASGHVKDVGPRSAHIADCGYCVFVEPEIIKDGALELIKPLPDDAREFAAIKGTDGKYYAVTLSCAANVAGYIKPGDYAYGNQVSAKIGMEKLAAFLGLSLDQAVKEIMSISVRKAETVVNQLIKDYELNKNMAILAGGGGGASGVIWALAEHLGMEAKLSRNAPVISTIGAALAMVRDVVERTVINPTEDDMLRIRKEAEHMAIESGANPASVEVSIEIDPTLNRVRAIAVGTTELVRKAMGTKDVSEDLIRQTAAQAMGLRSVSDLTLLSKNSSFYVFTARPSGKGLFSFFIKSKPITCIVDKKGIVKLRLDNAETLALSAQELVENTVRIVRTYAEYDESGERTPDVFLLVRAKLVEFKGLPTMDQLAALIKAEAAMVDGNEPIVIIARGRL
jgi:N-methylhydantoinase A/oxoprolinase/acetone carboxylase beta subunit